MINRKLQLSIISVLVICLVLFSSYGSLFGTVQHPKKTEAVVTEAAVAIVTCAVGVIVYTQFDKSYGPLVREKANDITDKWIEFAKADNNYDAFMDQITNALPYYPSLLSFHPTALSGLSINEMYNAVVAVLFPNETLSQDDRTHYYEATFISGNNSVLVSSPDVFDPVAFSGNWVFKSVPYGSKSVVYFIYKNDGSVFPTTHLTFYINNLGSYGVTSYTPSDQYVIDCGLTSFYGFRSPRFYASDTTAPELTYFPYIVDVLNGCSSAVNDTVTNLTTYPMPAQIPEDTMTAITNGDTDIPINNFANISFDNSTNSWTFDPDAYVLIDKTATPTVTPTPSPSPTVAPDPTPTATDGGGDSAGWLEAIYKKLVAIDAEMQAYWKQLFKDINIANDYLNSLVEKAVETGQDLNADGVDDGILGNITEIVKAFLEFIKSALVPTIDLDLDKLNKMPTNLSEKFPFCIPSDIVGLFKIFQADPVAPELHMSIPLQSMGFNQNLQIDSGSANFADNYAPIFRDVVFLAFVIWLFWLSYGWFKGGDS